MTNEEIKALLDKALADLSTIKESVNNIMLRYKKQQYEAQRFTENMHEIITLLTEREIEEIKASIKTVEAATKAEAEGRIK